jgi:membrane associated rhomboid family serine protease
MDSSDSHSSSPSSAPEPLSPFVTRRRREADEWALVLSAEGFEPAVVRSIDGYRIRVAEGKEANAAKILSGWRQERAERAERVELPPARSATSLEVATAYALALALLAFHLGLDVSGRYEALVQAGTNRASLVAEGEIWRLVTSLTLHADLSHVLGNTFFGGFFLAFVAGRLGIGLGVLAFVLTGTFGNLANDLYYGFDHRSIGASTGVFGLVGVLSGLAAWRRHQIATPGRGGWVAFGAGLGIVAMIGSGGPHIDISAHVFGMIVGGFVGMLVAIPLATRPHPGRAAQVAAFLFAISIVFGAWTRALAG